MPLEGLAQFEAAIERITDPKAILGHLAEHHGEKIVDVMIRQAKAGIGPGGKPYAPYSDSYKKQLGLKESGAGIKRYRHRKKVTVRKKGTFIKVWLFSTGGAEHMLDPDRFAWSDPDEKGIWLLWKGVGKQSVYGPVHQGTEYGGQTHTRGWVPPRPWLHFDLPATQAAVGKALDQTFSEMASDFNAGGIPE